MTEPSSPRTIDRDHRRKRIAFLRGSPGQMRDRFQQLLLERAHRIAAVEPVLSDFVVNLVGDTPRNAPYRPVGELNPTDAPVYDAILEWRPAGNADFNPVGGLAGDLLDACHCYDVEERIEKDERTVVPGARSPGVKYVGRLMFHADMPDSAVRRSWDLHVPLALRVHAGASRYVRNWVVGRAGSGAPQTRAITELHFQSEEDLVECFFDSEYGKREVLQDLSHFVAGGHRFYVSEYVLLRQSKAPESADPPTSAGADRY